MNFRIRRFEEEANKIIEKHQIPGTGIGFNFQGKRIYNKGIGYRDVDEQLPITPDTVFGIASLTKSFTCVAIMKLQEQGKLAVDDKIVTYLPELKFSNEEYIDRITIHQLMTHTAGFPPLATHKYARKRSVDADPSAKDYGLDLIENDGEPIDTYEEFIDYISSGEFMMLGTPGTQFSYSNDSYGLLGVIISRASGQTYESFVEENILKPAQMVNSFFDLEKIGTRHDVTVLYASKKENGKEMVYPAPMWWDAPSMRAAGYLKSSVNDILNYLEIVRNKGVIHSKQILTNESVDQLIYPHVQISPGRFYGYGFFITPNYYGSTLIEHGGGLKGVSSFMSVVPEKELTGVVLTNLSGVPAENILTGAINLIHEKEFSSDPITYEEESISSEKLGEFTGTFTSSEGMKISFFVIENQLMLDSQDISTNTQLQYIGNDCFITPQKHIIRFIKDGQGNVVRVFYGTRQISKDRE